MEILYQDQQIIVCIKEVGIDSEIELPALLKELCNSEIYPLHRLDQNVGGIMIYAKTKQSAAYFSKLIQEGKMIKEYICCIHGILENKEGILEDLLFKDRKKNKVFVVSRERKGVKKAKLVYDVIKQLEDRTLVHVRLYTGRSHQIRVQFSSRKHPLVGDHKYGSKDERKEPMLYSCKITFPYHNQEVTFEHYPEWATQSL